MPDDGGSLPPVVKKPLPPPPKTKTLAPDEKPVKIKVPPTGKPGKAIK